MIENCENCLYRHKLKYMAHIGCSYKWKYRDICTMRIETEGGEDAYAIYVRSCDMCEAFMPRSDEE